jgi:alkyl hydroperoxide reductase subunit D
MSCALATGKKAKRPYIFNFEKEVFMSQVSALSEKIADFGRDVRLNLEAVLSTEGAPGLSKEQIGGVALACAYSVNHHELAEALIVDLQIPTETATAAKAAATIMAMNNIYYRFVHLCEDKEFAKIPAKLRMNIIGKPGVAKVDFELMSLAISAIAGCGMCINSHMHELKKASISNEGIQSAVRIGSVINAAKTALALS